MKKIILIVIMLMVASSVKAVLIDSEEFESYTINSKIDNQTSDWECFSGLYTLDGCTRTIGTPTGSGGNFVLSESGNKYLTVFALGGVTPPATNYYQTALKWKHTNSTIAGTSQNYSVTYRMRLTTYQDDFVNGTENLYAVAGSVFDGFSQKDHLIGYDGTCGEGDCQLNLSLKSGTPSIPITSGAKTRSGCDVPNDSTWHYYSFIYYFNSATSRHETTWIYKDGVLCDEITYGAGDMYAGVPLLKEMSLVAQGTYRVDFDDLALYENETVIVVTTPINETACDNWSLPYYLVETFVGYPNLCDWSTSQNIFFTGELDIDQTIDFYSQHKDMSELIEDDNTRYVTMDYDLNIIDVDVGSTITFRLYDDDNFNFLTVFYRDSGEDLWYNDDGTGIVALSNITLSTVYPYKFVVDLQDDEFDIYFNDSLIVTDAGFTDAFFNIESIKTMKVQSNNAEYTLDNLYIYASDSLGNPQVPDEVLTPIIQNETAFCGLFYKFDTECSADEDCESGECMPNGKCNRFDLTYCDEEGMTRGNKCVIAAITSCGLVSTRDLIFDNFLLFLVLLVIIIGLAYLLILFKK